MAAVVMFSAEKFVWVDESGCDRRDQIRKFGYALQGKVQYSIAYSIEDKEYLS